MHSRIQLPRLAQAFLLAAVAFFLLPADAATAQRTGLTLEQAIALARTRNERALAAREYADAADARVAQVRSAFLPTVTLTGTYTRRAFETIRMVGSDEITIQSLNALSATANADLTLLSPSLFPTYARARHERDASVATALQGTLALEHEVAAAFLRAQSLGQVSEAARRRLQFALANLAAAQARFSAQITGANDVTRAELEAATAGRENTRADGNARTAALELTQLLNVAEADTLLPPEPLLQEAETVVLQADALRAVAMRERLDARAAAARTAGLDASTQEALFRMFPRLAATGQYRATNEAGFSGKSTNWYVGANLTWTLFDGGLWFADHSERSALAHAADLERQELERRIALDIDAALLALATARAITGQARVARDVALRNAAESAELYRQGLTGALEAADANVGLFEAEVAYTSARNDLANALISVRAAAGLTPLGGIIEP